MDGNASNIVKTKNERILEINVTFQDKDVINSKTYVFLIEHHAS